MPRALRIEYPGAIYHVMNRGDHREAIFRDDFDRRRFLTTLGETCGNRVGVYAVVPVLTITNPPGGTVSVPMIQLAGWVNESLSNLTFDVSNAVGVITNQQGYWEPAYNDTDLLTFTTNSFQCYDIALTNGVNLITLHATDFKGNTTTTNFSYTLSYAGVTDPPGLTVVWPPDNTAVGGGNFTLQAQIDDATATVTATVNSNTITALVERSGAVWFGNLPLNTGNNTVILTATSAAGNTRSRMLNVIQSAVTLTIDPISDDQLNQASVFLTGTVGNLSDNVWVNGVRANVFDDGTWEANDVPVKPTGMAMVVAQAGMAVNNITASATLNQSQPALNSTRQP